jgi:hypothetical protein
MAVCRCKVVHVEGATAGGATTMELGCVEGCLADLHQGSANRQQWLQ